MGLPAIANPVEFGASFGPTPAPWDTPDAWDTFYVSDVPWQGKIEISGAARTYKWDIKKAPGLDGFQQTYQGKPHKPFRVRFYMWTSGMYYYFINIIQPLLSAKGPLVVPVTVYHPSLSNLGLSAVTVDSIGAIVKLSDDLMFACDVEMHEFFPSPPIPVTTTPVAAVGVNPNIPGTPPPTAAITAAESAKARANQSAALGLAGGLPF